jgi:signal transduction histidine kinase
VLDALRRRESDVLAIMITAFATLETAIRATKSGAFDFLAKPFTPEELRDTVRKAAAHLVVQREARRLAAERRRVRFEFISVLAHELKAPLAAIEGYLNIVRDQAMGPEVAAYGPAIGRCLVRAGGMRKLIADLLDMTRIESGVKKRELAPLNLREVVDAGVDTIQPDADARRISIHVDCPACVPLLAERSEIEIVLNNLLSNAVKYNRDGGRVELSVAGDAERVEIRVRDTGIGLTPDESAKLFGDFVRIKNDKTRNILGSGLGLSVVRKLALLYGGQATVASTPDVGSVFTVALRRDGRSAAPAADAAPNITHAEPTADSELAERN